ncbi:MULTISPECIES: formyltetrahydrofolate deformylase [unclassified Shewanella]|uniref:formyltetrahydrofolate deformylase n=1 Tax=unclassified Shewanella TaxID=196818 RepID=UPI000C84A014|nr:MULTISPECIES: formyltetrahydrofolate deformylase [unclassified Shewanella]MDO6617705.1 formyltetrahydrofolate deformylase [Shewanella sp. 6_MG-2023]PMG31107.1 formyltetrahydrofolate deformylase [Shewanella sp. 10N.286.52.C2]PMH87561.1 formyltetrahydrofolate deformylase [Shewanella sp. 10N.286.48.B5]PMH96945.1 formyltetrahydrofolate deformylase [Shewanella sp. 10N.286.48.A6]
MKSKSNPVNNTASLERKILITDCEDAKGLIAKITGVCFAHKLNIIKNTEFVDHEQGRFFMRTVLEGQINDQQLLADLTEVLPLQNHMKLVDAGRKRIVILVTKEAHCLGDILMKSYYGGLDVEIAAVVGNYDVLQGLTEKFDIPFHHVSHEGLDRAQHEQAMLEVIKNYNADYIVLAKYMRILTPEFVAEFPNTIINIHHSFLPAFIGASPYRQAWERGVKIIGATAHFVNNCLDEGPIIKQDVINVDHSFSAEELAHNGRDVEKSVLSKALQLVLDEQVVVYGNKTVVF